MRELSTAAQAAKLIRAELKEKFPSTKFSVTSENYSMGDSVWVRWDDEQAYEAVMDLTNKYQYGEFDSMRDIYINSNLNKDIPQVKHIIHQRN